MVKLEISVALSGVGGSDMEILVELISAVEKMGLDGGNLVRLPWQFIYLIALVYSRKQIQFHNVRSGLVLSHLWPFTAQNNN